MKDYITIIGGGLAGCEAAYQIAKAVGEGQVAALAAGSTFK